MTQKESALTSSPHNDKNIICRHSPVHEGLVDSDGNDELVPENGDLLGREPVECLGDGLKDRNVAEMSDVGLLKFTWFNSNSLEA